MKTLAFASRNTKEMVRDPMNLAFGIGFPVVLLLLLSAINSSIPAEANNDSFAIVKLAPGIAVFGLSFISLFSAMLISKDRASSFILRLFTSPLKSSDFIVGYMLPLIPMAIAQMLVTFAVALILGLEFSVNILMTLVALLPSAILFIALGLLCGTVLNDKAVGGICGALLTNLTAWLSGIWFDISLVGGAFEFIANCLPFVHGVDAAKAAMRGDFGAIFPDLWWVIGYTVVIMAIAIFLFNRKMKSDK